MEKLLIY
jgi:hypothetical protein